MVLAITIEEGKGAVVAAETLQSQCERPLTGNCLVLRDKLLFEASQPDRALISFLVHDTSPVVVGALEMGAIFAEVSALAQLRGMP